MYKIIEGYKVGPRTTWYEDDNYEMSYEEIDGQIYIHIVVDKMNKKVFRDIQAKWNDFLLRLYSLGYEYVFTYTKDLRIPRMVGGKVIGQWKENKVVAWELK